MLGPSAHQTEEKHTFVSTMVSAVKLRSVASAGCAMASSGMSRPSSMGKKDAYVAAVSLLSLK